MVRLEGQLDRALVHVVDGVLEEVVVLNVVAVKALHVLSELPDIIRGLIKEDVNQYEILLVPFEVRDTLVSVDEAFIREDRPLVEDELNIHLLLDRFSLLPSDFVGDQEGVVQVEGILIQVLLKNL